jgi:hypothetical protein
MHQMVKRTRRARLVRRGGESPHHVDALPPWTGDDKAMLRWLRARCRELFQKELNEQLCIVTRLELELERKFPARDLAVLRAIAAAENGDIRPLRAAVPRLAKFLHLPKLHRGETFRRKQHALALDTNENDRLYIARLMTKRVQLLWLKYYDKKNRKRDEKSAAWFAARMFGLTEEKVSVAIKTQRPKFSDLDDSEMWPVD